MQQLPLTGKYSKGQYAIVDDDVVLPKGKWQLTWNGYVTKTIDGKTRTLQGWLMNTPPDKVTDHINRDKLDNRRSNLQVCTRGLNSQRVGKLKTNTSGLLGVIWYNQTKRWRAGIMFNQKWKHLGYFFDKAAAARAYNKAARTIFGDSAIINQTI
jgi:hypothetical protein